MIEKLFAMYFDDLTVEDINDLLKALKYNGKIVDFVDVDKIDYSLTNYTQKLCIKEDGDYLNIKFNFFEPTEEDLQFMVLHLSGADSTIKEYQMKNDLEISNIESILIVKEPITEKHNNTFSIFDEEYAIPVFSLSELNNKTTGNEKIDEKLSKLKNMDVNEYLGYFLSTMDVDEINKLLKLLCADLEIEELIEINFKGFKIAKSKNNDYYSIVLRYEESNQEFMEDLIGKSKEVLNELNIDKPLFTLLLVIDGKSDDSNIESMLNNIKTPEGVEIKRHGDISNLIGIDDECIREKIEDLKLSFGDILDEPSNINAIFSLLDKDVEINTFLDFKFDNDNETTSHKVAIDNTHHLLNLVLHFGEYDEELLKQEAENARKISKELNNSSPIKTYVILIADSIDEKVQYMDFDDEGRYDVEFCSMYEANPKNNLKKLFDEASR